MMLSGVLVLIAGVLLYYFHDVFLPRPTGEPVVLAVPPRLLMPPRSAATDQLYERTDFQALLPPGVAPLRPVELNGSGSPFDDIFPERREIQP